LQKRLSSFPFIFENNGQAKEQYDLGNPEREEDCSWNIVEKKE